MSKYIDSEKLIAELTKLQFTLNASYRKPQSDNIVRAISIEYDDILSLVDSLQQEQPMHDSTKLIELWHEDKEMLKEKDFRDDPWRLAYNAFMCGFGRGIAVNKQEQPEVDLLKKALDDYYNKVEFGPSDAIEYETHKEIARHFYELGLNARKEE